MHLQLIPGVYALCMHSITASWWPNVAMHMRQVITQGGGESHQIVQSESDHMNTRHGWYADCHYNTSYRKLLIQEAAQKYTYLALGKDSLCDEHMNWQKQEIIDGWRFEWKDGFSTEQTNTKTKDLELSECKLTPKGEVFSFLSFLFLSECSPYLCCLFCTAHRLHDQQPRGKAHQQADGEPVHDPQHLEGPVVRSGHQSHTP